MTLPALEQLQAQLEHLRRRHRHDQLDLDEVQIVLDEANELRDTVAGGPLEPTLDVIVDLLESIRATAETRLTLRDCRAMLARVN